MEKQSNPIDYGPICLNAEEFTRRRLDAGWSISDIAARIGVGKSTLYRHVNHQVQYANPVVVEKLSALFPGRSLWIRVDQQGAA